MGFLGGLFGGRDGAGEERATLTAPVDLNQPVENPALSVALGAFTLMRTERTEQELTRQLRQAVFLAPMLADEFHSTPNGDGSSTVEQGSVIKLITCSDPEGNEHLPLFTDWQAIRSWTDQEVSTLVLPAADAWGFVLSQDNYAGAVVNPGNEALPLPRGAIEHLHAGG